jgi:glycosyltransferase involved in cell wall biosynthesis
MLHGAEKHQLKIVMINDCASIGETLLRYIPQEIERQHIKRTRGLWSKTLGIAYQILRSKGDVYQANYLLQDCYIASRLHKKPLVGYAVGSDLRVYLNHWMWGRIMRHNLKNCDKIIVSTPDLKKIAEPFRNDAEYMPPPVDPEIFYPKPPLTLRADNKKKVLLASNLDWQGKGTDSAIRALSKIKEEIQISIIARGQDLGRTLKLASTLDLRLDVLPKVSHEEMNKYFWETDVVLDQFKVGCPGSIVIESIACNRPAVTYVSSAFPEYSDLPLKDIDSEDKIAGAVIQACTDSTVLEKQRQYVERNHGVASVVERFMNMYNALTKL